MAAIRALATVVRGSGLAGWSSRLGSESSLRSICIDRAESGFLFCHAVPTYVLGLLPSGWCRQAAMAAS
jgi:hypothetical protein